MRQSLSLNENKERKKKVDLKKKLTSHLEMGVNERATFIADRWGGARCGRVTGPARGITSPIIISFSTIIPFKSSRTLL